MKKQDMLERIRALGLPPGQFVVFGSGPLCVRNLRECEDIDLVVTPPLFQALKRRWGAETLVREDGTRYEKVVCAEQHVELGIEWDYRPLFQRTLDQLIGHGDIFHGIAFASLVDVLLWKQALRRPKDLEDIALIRAYLKNRLV